VHRVLPPQHSYRLPDHVTILELEQVRGSWRARVGIQQCKFHDKFRILQDVNMSRTVTRRGSGILTENIIMVAGTLFVGLLLSVRIQTSIVV
jgi:hypothetical protein